jgi:hypothetical protein
VVAQVVWLDTVLPVTRQLLGGDVYIHQARINLMPGALWFDANLLHGSGSNITPLPRSNVFLVFNSVDNQLGEPFAAPRRRPEYLAAR